MDQTLKVRAFQNCWSGKHRQLSDGQSRTPRLNKGTSEAIWDASCLIWEVLLRSWTWFQIPFDCKTVINGFMQASQIALVVQYLPANAGVIRDTSSIPGSGISPEEHVAIHSSILAWRIPWTEESGGLQSIASQRAGHDWGNRACTRTHRMRSKRGKPPTVSCSLDPSVSPGNELPLKKRVNGNLLDF